MVAGDIFQIRQRRFGHLEREHYHILFVLLKLGYLRQKRIVQGRDYFTYEEYNAVRHIEHASCRRLVAERIALFERAVRVKRCRHHGVYITGEFLYILGVFIRHLTGGDGVVK